MTPILLFGANGQVGWELQRALSPLGTVTAVDHTGAISPTLLQSAPPLPPSNRASSSMLPPTAVDRAESEPNSRVRSTPRRRLSWQKPRKRWGRCWCITRPTMSSMVVETDTVRRIRCDGADVRLRHDQTRRRTAVVAAGGRALDPAHQLGLRCPRQLCEDHPAPGPEGRALRIDDDQVGAPTPAALISDVTGQILAATRRGSEIGDARLYHLAAANPSAGAVLPARSCGRPLRRQDSPPCRRRKRWPALRRLTIPCPRSARRTPADCGRWSGISTLNCRLAPFLGRMLQLLALKSANGST